ncbi:hypothetical protein ACN6K5_002886 [Streptomyces violaceoruber]|uniref:hypothetical protein n=1 Tax=Streptomyces violaceoruber group TaxID=2867121 RepID=UPI0033D76FF4
MLSMTPPALSGRPPLPVRPQPHERDGRQPQPGGGQPHPHTAQHDDTTARELLTALHTDYAPSTTTGSPASDASGPPTTPTTSPCTASPG